MKAPVYSGEAPITDEQLTNLNEPRDFEMLPNLGHMGGYMWESEDGAARGTLRFKYAGTDTEGNNIGNHNLLINNFEVGLDNRGQGKAHEYLSQMIDEGGEQFIGGMEPFNTHVTNVEPHTKDFWDKMVDAGIINGAHETGHIRRNLDGSIKNRYVGRRRQYAWEVA